MCGAAERPGRAGRRGAGQFRAEGGARVQEIRFTCRERSVSGRRRRAPKSKQQQPKRPPPPPQSLARGFQWKFSAEPRARSARRKATSACLGRAARGRGRGGAGRICYLGPTDGLGRPDPPRCVRPRQGVGTLHRRPPPLSPVPLRAPARQRGEGKPGSHGPPSFFR